MVPGDSPMGFRLPLDSIPWVNESEYPHLFEQDPMAERAPLPDRAALSGQQRYVAGRRRISSPAGIRGANAGIGSGAATVAPANASCSICLRRQGESAPLDRFAPRCARKCAAASCACSCRRSTTSRIISTLVAAIEDTAADLGIPVLVEGYAPPHDSRVQRDQSDARSRRDRSEHCIRPQAGMNW